MGYSILAIVMSDRYGGLERTRSPLPLYRSVSYENEVPVWAQRREAVASLLTLGLYVEYPASDRLVYRPPLQVLLHQEVPTECHYYSYDYEFHLLAPYYEVRVVPSVGDFRWSTPACQAVCGVPSPSTFRAPVPRILHYRAPLTPVSPEPPRLIQPAERGREAGEARLPLPVTSWRLPAGGS